MNKLNIALVFQPACRVAASGLKDKRDMNNLFMDKP